MNDATLITKLCDFYHNKKFAHKIWLPIIKQSIDFGKFKNPDNAIDLLKEAMLSESKYFKNIGIAIDENDVIKYKNYKLCDSTLITQLIDEGYTKKEAHLIWPKIIKSNLERGIK